MNLVLLEIEIQDSKSHSRDAFMHWQNFSIKRVLEWQSFLCARKKSFPFKITHLKSIDLVFDLNHL